MRKRNTVIYLEADELDSVWLMSDRIDLAEDQVKSVETLTRVFKFPADCFYGELEVNRAKMSSMISNFEKNVYGQKISINLAHNDSRGAAGEITRVFRQGNKLRGEIDWTPLGIDAIHNKGFRYFSIEFDENYEDPEAEVKHGPLLLGAALTIRPRVKHLDPVDPEKIKLSFDEEGDEPPYAILPNVKRMLSEEITKMWDKLRKLLEEKLTAKKLHDNVLKQLSTKFMESVKDVTDETQAKALMEGFIAAGDQIAVQLAEQGEGAGVIKLDISIPDMPTSSVGLDEAAVKKLMANAAEEAAKEARKLTEDKEVNVEIFNTAIDAAEGLKSLSEDQLTTVKSAADLITAEMTEDQVKSLAENQIKLGNDIAVAAQLAARGFDAGPNGYVHITVDESNSIKALQEKIDERLGITKLSERRRFESTGGKLLPENKDLTEKVLEIYDREHAYQLHAEAKMLAGGDGIVSDVAVPATFERTVIREALYDLVGLQFVDSGVLTMASSHLIPYSYRDTTAAGKNSARVYEGGSIPRAGLIQTSETAYPIPQKIAFEVSDELRYLTGSGIINWDALIENQRNASRIVGEDMEQMIFNEILHASDEYAAVALGAAEVLDAQLDGTDNVYILANFPVVRPRQVFDLQGNQVGVDVNAIVVTYNDGGGADVLLEYDGTGTQPAADYYVMDYNLGEIRIVNQAGAIQTPLVTDTLSVDYSYATNRYAFDTDLPANTDTDVHWDSFLYRYGLRKSEIEDLRYHRANFGLMSGTSMTQIEQAKQFAANSKRPGTELMQDGNLGRVKDIPNFKTSAPALWMGDQRVIIGERGQTRLRMMKPWTMGELENQKDANGRFTGKKEAYGDQFLILHTPTQLKRAYTSIVTYSATARVDRVE